MLIKNFIKETELKGLTGDFVFNCVNLDDSKDIINYITLTSVGYGLIHNHYGKKRITLKEFIEKFTKDLKDEVVRNSSELVFYSEEFCEIYEIYDIEYDMEKKEINILI